MKTEIILKVSKLKNLVEWIDRNFVCGERSTNARTLYVFANKPGTSMEVKILAIKYAKRGVNGF